MIRDAERPRPAIRITATLASSLVLLATTYSLAWGAVEESDLGWSHTSASIRTDAPLVPRPKVDDKHRDEIDVTAADPGSPGVPPVEPPPPDVITQTLPWEPEDCQIITIPIAEPNLRAQCANPATFVCPAGTTGVTAYKYRTRPLSSSDGWSGWRLLNGPCAPAGSTADDLAAAVARELKTLKIPPKHAKIAPITDWFAVQTPMTYYTDNTRERLTTTILGTRIELELTPSSFSWDPGDGSRPLTTTEPGARYPDQTITHTYTKIGTYRVTLTTTWTGRFRTPGGTWQPIDGTGTTTHTTTPFETREIRSVLS